MPWDHCSSLSVKVLGQIQQVLLKITSTLQTKVNHSKMAADDRAARHVIKQRIKPEIYTTIDGKIIVEDELLSFLFVKLKTVPQDDIILMAVNHFGSEWIETPRRSCLNYVLARGSVV